MGAQEMIRQYKAIDEPVYQYGAKRPKWMDNLGKVNIALPICGALLLIGTIFLFKKER